MAKKTLTTDQGVPVSDYQNSLTSGQRGPAFLQDIHLIENQEMTL
jgi:catalase